jgi:hypothetical protein
MCLTIDGFSPQDGEFGVDRRGQHYILPWRLHFANGRTMRVAEDDMDRLIEFCGTPDKWHRMTVVATSRHTPALSGARDDKQHQIAERLHVDLF